MEQKKWKNKNFLQALIHSLDGIKYTLSNEQNLKIQLFFAILVIGLGFLLKINTFEFLILIITIALVLFAEMMNTCIEVCLDNYNKKYNEKIKVAKDVASGAVLILAVMSVIIGFIIFLPKIIIIL